MKYYPVSLNLVNKLVVVVGGGMIAERKVKKLLDTEAKITVISPEVSEDLLDLVTKNLISWHEKNFSKEDIGKAFVVIAATNLKEVNQQVLAACGKKQLINIVDDPTNSSFIVPATLTRGKLDLSVSTSGASPSLAKKIIQDLSEEYDDTYENYLDFLADCRFVVLKDVADLILRKKILKNLLDPIFLELTRKERFQERKLLFQKMLEKGGEVNE